MTPKFCPDTRANGSKKRPEARKVSGLEVPLGTIIPSHISTISTPIYSYIGK